MLVMMSSRVMMLMVDLSVLHCSWFIVESHEQNRTCSVDSQHSLQHHGHRMKATTSLLIFLPCTPVFHC
jgi:hypothetical protein